MGPLSRKEREDVVELSQYPGPFFPCFGKVEDKFSELELASLTRGVHEFRKAELITVNSAVLMRREYFPLVWPIFWMCFRVCFRPPFVPKEETEPRERYGRGSNYRSPLAAGEGGIQKHGQTL